MSPRLPSWERRHGHHGASWRGALAHSPDTLQTLCSRRAAIVSLTPLTKIHTSKTRVHTHGRRKYAGAARIVTIVELHVTYYSPRAWACYQKLLDPAVNWGGYGYDVWLQNYMVDHCALREPRMGILDGYSATHAHEEFRKGAGPAGQQLRPAARAHNGSRYYQMLNMEKVMRQRGTPVRHSFTLRHGHTPLLSTESPSNKSILQLHKACVRVKPEAVGPRAHLAALQQGSGGDSEPRRQRASAAARLSKRRAKVRPRGSRGQ